MTGDMQLSRAEVEETSVIVATPEKWDIATRKAGDKYFLELVTLLIIDEVHLLHDSRGPVLEAIVARTLRFCESSGQVIRIVGLSATLPNYQDVALFLRVNATEDVRDKSNGLFFFDNHSMCDGGYRPIPLEQQYLGVTDDKGVKRLLLMKELLYTKVIERVSRQQILVFVHSRRETVKTADELREQAIIQDQLGKFVRDDENTKTILSEVAGKFTSAELRRLVPFGVAVHHAGLARGDRELVESLFADKRIQVLISTATLAWGVNLPAKTVIIKGTQVYSPEKGKWIELSPQDLLQMLGRAGRPGFDSSGEGLILTSYKELKYYLSLVNSQLPIESQFISQLADQLNAEIVLGSISNLSEAVKWLSYTYLYVRMLLSPKIYGVTVDEFESDKSLVQRRVNLIHSAAALLDKNCLIRYNRATGEFQTTTLGRIASHYYIKQASMAVYAEHIKPNITMIDLFRIFSLSAEFQHVPVRDEEKSEMEKLLATVPVPVRTSKDDPASKVNVLLQAYISRKKLEGYAVNSDMVYVTQSAARIMRGLFEVFLKRGWASVAENCLRLCLMVDRQQWSCMSPLRQYTGLREEILRRMENQEHLTWEHFCSMTAAQVGNVIRHEREGPHVHKLIHQFPRLELDALVQPISRSTIRVELKVKCNFEWDAGVSGRREPFWIMVTDVDNELLLHHEFFTLSRDEYKEPRMFEFTVPLLEPLNPHYFVKVVSDRWLQCQSEIPISFKNLILPARFPQPAELTDRPAIMREHFDDARVRQVLEDFKIRSLNAIQTECYEVLTNSQDNYLLCAPGNSGKTVAFLLAASQVLAQKGAEAKILVIVPLKSQVNKRRDILKRLASAFNVHVAVLAGQTTPDLAALANSQVVLTTAANWDNISRRWRKRSDLLLFDLVLLDQIHLIDTPGAAYEAVASRVRYIAATLAADEENPHHTRLAIHGACIANSRDVAEWLGVQPEHTFNFSPKVRPIPLETAITAFEQHDSSVRFFAMTRQLAQDLVRMTRKRESVIVFVADKQAARLGAAHLLNYAQSKARQAFLTADTEESQRSLASAIHDVKLKDLQLLLESGIGYTYEGMGETHIVERLFRRGVIGVLFVPHNMVYSVEVQAHTVAVLDCKYLQEQRLVDYTAADLQAMMARAGRPGVDLSSHAIVYVPGPSKESVKKALTDSIPVESRLHQHLAEHINAEIFSETLETKQDCLDWLAWSLFFRRVRQNPNYYGLVSTADLQLSAHLSELVEAGLEELMQLDCVRVEPSEEGDPTKDKLVLTNGGTVAATYYVNTYTVGLFNTFLKENSKLKDILSHLSAATEFEDIPVRTGEQQRLKQLYTEVKYKPEKPSFSDPGLKTQVLLQTHFDRKPLVGEFKADRERAVVLAVRLIHAMVYCLGDKAWLKPAILAMKLCQMAVQAMWSTDSPLLQLPHLTAHTVERLAKPEYSI